MPEAAARLPEAAARLPEAAARSRAHLAAGSCCCPSLPSDCRLLTRATSHTFQFDESDIVPSGAEGWSRLPDVWGDSVHDQKAARRARTARQQLRTQIPLVGLQPYVPGAIWGKILARDASWILRDDPRVRTVTLLSIKLELSAEGDPMTKVATYTSLVSILQESLYRVQGTFKHMMASDTGCVLVACLGLPPFNHSTVPCTQGAVQVVVDMRKAACDVGVQVYSAVLTGAVWIGTTGCDSRHEYMLIGEPMQLASQVGLSNSC